VHCPQCDIDVSGSDDSLAVHFREAKTRESTKDQWQWHSFSFTFKADWCKKGSIHIYRERSFEFSCPCGNFSHYEKADMTSHLASLNEEEKREHREQSLTYKQPPWTRAGRL
jgi:hypothetical protein